MRVSGGSRLEELLDNRTIAVDKVFDDLLLTHIRERQSSKPTTAIGLYGFDKVFLRHLIQ
jgi:hypothetical protein